MLSPFVGSFNGGCLRYIHLLRGPATQRIILTQAILQGLGVHPSQPKVIQLDHKTIDVLVSPCVDHHTACRAGNGCVGRRGGVASTPVGTYVSGGAVMTEVIHS
jgi:hypothetical protein